MRNRFISRIKTMHMNKSFGSTQGSLVDGTHQWSECSVLAHVFLSFFSNQFGFTALAFLTPPKTFKLDMTKWISLLPKRICRFLLNIFLMIIRILQIVPRITIPYADAVFDWEWLDTHGPWVIAFAVWTHSICTMPCNIHLYVNAHHVEMDQCVLMMSWCKDSLCSDCSQPSEIYGIWPQWLSAFLTDVIVTEQITGDS